MRVYLGAALFVLSVIYFSSLARCQPVCPGVASWSVNGVPAVVAINIPSPPWLANTTASQWLASTPDQSKPTPMGNYAWRCIPNLVAGTITGRFMADDAGTLKVGGVTVATTAHDFRDWTPFSATATAGLNLIEVTVFNFAGATGLRFEATLTPTPVAPPVIPPVVIPPIIPPVVTPPVITPPVVPPVPGERWCTSVSDTECVDGEIISTVGYFVHRRPRGGWFLSNAALKGLP